PPDVSGLLLQELAAHSFDAAEQISSDGFSYDARGRRTQDPTRTYIWDNANRLVQIDENGTVTTLDYTAQGEIASRAVGGVTTNFVHHYALPGSPIMAEVRNGDFVRFYVYTPSGLLLYFIDVPSTEPYFYHFNQVGTTLFLTDDNGNVSDTYGYNVYGKQLAHSGPNGEQLFTFNGEYGVRHEGASGLYQMGQRYYDSTTLQFLSREPLWPLLLIPQALNPYQFALQNPLRFVDPSGLNPQENRVANGADWNNITNVMNSTQGKDNPLAQTFQVFNANLASNLLGQNGNSATQNSSNSPDLMPSESKALSNVPQSNRQASNNSSYLNDLERFIGRTTRGTDHFQNANGTTGLGQPNKGFVINGSPFYEYLNCFALSGCSITNTPAGNSTGWLALLLLFSIALGIFWLRSSRLGEGNADGTAEGAT
ncbi:MAG: RHS repeat-associated core domain-containing protein, partial [Caldilineaceae bacterium]|nr:RHS repeat-associated core domain-containing protein [Caldilineaceae bacterium]